MLRVALLLLVVAAPALAVAGEPPLAGPFVAEVLRVVDGDTLEARVRIWLRQDVTIDIRLRGIDAPELKGRCRDETILAAAATDRLAELAGKTISLTEIGEDKYGGRVLARVVNAEGGDVGALMLESGLARAYIGGRRGDWCGLARLEGN
ncbi:MAG: thermonuclease family protein [Bauldia sp.]